MQRFEKWTETYTRFLKSDREGALEPKQLEDFAVAAYLTGKDTECFQILERAQQGYLDQNKKENAARCIFWLAFMLMNFGELARSSGWIARGERLLNNGQGLTCAENGLLLILPALAALYTGDVRKAQKLFEQAGSIGEQFNDPDLIALSRLGHGQAIIQQGDVAKGIKLLDEAMTTVEAEEVFPVVNGIVYCAVIECCHQVWDFRRAHEWTAVLSRWCDENPDIIPFRGQCLVRRAEIIQFHGEWPKALEETKDACALLTQPPGERAAGEAYYRQAELHRLLGGYAEAEECYGEAAKWGKKPQPGLALLRLAKGQENAAETSIRNTLIETKDIQRRAALLPAFVIIMIAVKQTAEAHKASDELCRIAEKFQAPFLHAMSAFCQAVVFLEEEKFRPALDQLHHASTFLNSLHLPYESARTRELKGIVYRKFNDKDNSEIELIASRWIFEQLKAAPDIKRIDRLLNTNRDQQTYGLTLRELQVLRLVASGKTNKSVASELFVSERTIDRHVSNIFNKLGVSSRVAATTFAIQHNMTDNLL